MRTHAPRIATILLLPTVLLLCFAALEIRPALAGTAPAQGGSGPSPTDQEPVKDQKDGQAPAGAPAAAQTSMLKAPDFTLKDLQGRSIHLAELLKKGPVYLDFWTTWCIPCRREMPELDRIHKAYRDRGFAVVAVALDDTRTVARVRPYITSNKFEFFAAADPTTSVGNLYNVRAYPTSFMIKPDGTIAHFAQGYLPGDEKKIESLVRELLGLGTGEQAPGATK